MFCAISATQKAINRDTLMQLHNTGASAMRAPAKTAPKKGVRKGGGSASASLAMRRQPSESAREPSKKRRIDTHASLPEALVEKLKAPKPKGQAGVYVPLARKLGLEEIQAQLDAESSGDDAISDSYYIELHLEAQRRAEVERGALAH
jgi:hypothetical protein